MSEYQKQLKTLDNAIRHFERLNDGHLIRSIAFKASVGFYLLILAFIFSNSGIETFMGWAAFLSGSFVLYRFASALQEQMTRISDQYAGWLVFTFEYFHSLELTELDSKVYEQRLKQLSAGTFHLFK